MINKLKSRFTLPLGAHFKLYKRVNNKLKKAASLSIYQKTSILHMPSSILSQCIYTLKTVADNNFYLF